MAVSTSFALQRNPDCFNKFAFYLGFCGCPLLLWGDPHDFAASPVIPEEELGSAVGSHRQPPWFQGIHRAQKPLHQLREDLLVELESSLVALKLRTLRGGAMTKGTKRLGDGGGMLGGDDSNDS